MSQPNIFVTASAPPRPFIDPATGKPVTQPTVSFHAQRFAFTIAWGSAPSSGTIDYVSEALISAVPITVGALVKIEVGGHVFWGICQGDAAEIGSGGRVRTLTFTDVREFLQHDIVYGAFNIRDVRMLGNVRIKRWKHLLPGDYNAMLWTYTSAPLSAITVLNLMFNAPTMQTPWLVPNSWFDGSVGNRGGYHRLQKAPVYDIDCLTGKTLQAALQEVSDKHGLTFGLMSTVDKPYILVWIRKGEGTLPLYANNLIFPLNSDDRRIAVRATGAAQRVRVLGSRNLYQVPNIELVPDWPRAWDDVTFGSEDLFLDFIYHKAKDPETGKLFTALDNDPDHLIGALRARVFAERMTVRNFVDFLGTIEYGRAQADFIDNRMFHGRSRMDMPVFIYLREIVYRAFALPTTLNHLAGDLKTNLDPFVLRNADGNVVPIESLHIVDRQLTRIVHEPVSGIMTAIGEEPVEGNGYCISQGCRIDGFANANPETFDLPQWKQMATFYQTINFHIDDSGLGVPFILLDEPIFVPTELFISIPPVPKGGEPAIVVMRSPFDLKFRLDVPRVRATLIFEAETFSRVFPTDSRANLRDVVVNVGQINAEYYLDTPTNTWREIPYADGTYSTAKAWEQAEPLLDRPYAFFEGGYTVQGSNNTQLTSVIDRVTIESGPDGMSERVEFTKEATGAFESERDLDRKAIQDNAFPGQQEMLMRIRQEQVEIKALKQSKQLYQWVSDSLKGVIGRSADLHTVQLFNVLKTDAGYKSNMAVGTPLWRSSTAMRVVPPWKTDESWSVMAGVTVRENESVDNVYLRLQRSGVALARVSGVNGDVRPGDTLVQVVGKDYLAKKKGVKTSTGLANLSPGVALVAQDLATTSAAVLVAIIGASPLDFSASEEDLTYLRILGATDAVITAIRTKNVVSGTNAPIAGTAQGLVAASTPTAAPKLIWMHIGGAGGTGATSPDTKSVGQFVIVGIKGDYLLCRTLSGTGGGTTDIPVAKTWMLRRSSPAPPGYSYLYDRDLTGEAADGTTRTKYGPDAQEDQIVTPIYFIGAVIYAVKNIDGGTGVKTEPVPTATPPVVAEDVTWLELSDGRAWAQKPPPDS